MALFENDSLQDISGSTVIRTLQSQIFSEDGSPRVQFLYTRNARGQVKVYNVKGQLVLDDRGRGLDDHLGDLLDELLASRPAA